MVLTGKFLYICQLYMYIHLYINISALGISVKKKKKKFEQSMLIRSFSECLHCLCKEIFQKQYGFPEGSVLGPLLFLIYINDMQIAVKCNLFLYADDTCLVFQSKNVMDIKKQLNEDCQVSCIICNFVIICYLM